MKTININGTRFSLPESMTTKDIQSLVGFLSTLSTVDSHYDYNRSEYLYSLGRFPELRIEELELTADAKAKADASYEEWKAKRDAEKATA